MKRTDLPLGEQREGDDVWRPPWVASTREGGGREGCSRSENGHRTDRCRVDEPSALRVVVDASFRQLGSDLGEQVGQLLLLADDVDPFAEFGRQLGRIAPRR